MKITNNISNTLSEFKKIKLLLSEADFNNSQEFARLSKEYARLEPIANKAMQVKSIEEELEGLYSILQDPTADLELKHLAEVDIISLKSKRNFLWRELKIMLLPHDKTDCKNVIIEIRAATGGGEASLFAADLLKMYHKYSIINRWNFEILNSNDTLVGGIKEASAIISGKNVFGRLRFESGVHRVQRIPETEATGRIHTSAATIAVLPEAKEIDIHIDDKDIRVDVYRASGPGGQSVNTTDSAVRITHIPTGIVVCQQDEKSQHKNKSKGMKILRSRLYDNERSCKDAKRAAERKVQVGRGDRSERIRTYNFPQGRVTDHRINFTLYKLDRVLDGSFLDKIIQLLVDKKQEDQLIDVIR